MNSTNDPGDGVCTPVECTLAEAITAANSASDPDIVFGIPDNDPGKNPDGTFTIYTYGLPTITSETRIDATTQMGYAGKPLIILDGSLTTPGTDGFQVTGTGAAVKGFVISYFSGAGIHVLYPVFSPEPGATIQSNYIGTDVTGTQDNGNGYGVLVEGAGNVVIGGAAAGQRNVISGNDYDGIHVREYNSNTPLDGVIQGNYIGVDVSGQLPLQNTGAGISIEGGSGYRIGGAGAGQRNVISGNGSMGIRIGFGAAPPYLPATGNVVSGNYIGINAAGSAAIPNNTGILTYGASDTIIGGTRPGERNVISGNTYFGVSVAIGAGNSVLGNYIGTNATGDAGLGNGAEGIRVYANNGVIGGAEPGAGNVISGNAGTGVYFGANPDPDGNLVQGNKIGTTAGGEPLGNGGFGIFMDSGDGNTIGGMSEGEGNIIAYNGKGGVSLHDPSSGDSLPLGNAILGNSIYDNGGAAGSMGLGIDLFNNGVTPNDPGDVDPGPNRLQDFPVLTSAKSGSITVEGMLNSTPGRDFRIELFANEDCDPSGYGEGQTYLGFTTAHTNAGGDALFSFQSGQAVPAGQFVTATATDLATNDTSEFSACREVEAGPTPTPTATPTMTATPAPTPTATPTGTPTPTGSPSGLIQGDVDCDGDADAVDALKVLRYVAGLDYARNAGCPDIGGGTPFPFGDVDCDLDVDSVDALKVLRYVAGLDYTQNGECPDIGGPL